MRRSLALLIAAGVVAGGWYFFRHYRIEGLESFRVTPRKPSGTESLPASYQPPPVTRTGETIRVASFNIQVFGETKLSKPHVVDVLARIVRQFDIVAVQEIRTRNQDLLPHFVDVVNAAGRHYDFVIGPRLGRSASQEQYAFIFDTASIEVDRNQLYTVEDPDDLLHREPLVGWFRVRGPPTDQAFTFTLVNIHTDPDTANQELDILDDVYQLVMSDGRGEDDVILLGDLNANDRELGELGRVSEIAWVISGVPTNTRGTQQYDNILFQQHATREFTGRGGVFDFLREYNLSLEEAIEVSDHLPVWAEFSIFEGGRIGRVAHQDPVTER